MNTIFDFINVDEINSDNVINKKVIFNKENINIKNKFQDDYISSLINSKLNLNNTMEYETINKSTSNIYEIENILNHKEDNTRLG